MAKCFALKQAGTSRMLVFMIELFNTQTHGERERERWLDRLFYIYISQSHEIHNQTIGQIVLKASLPVPTKEVNVNLTNKRY
jgi:hypothetical protein